MDKQTLPQPLDNAANGDWYTVQTVDGTWSVFRAIVQPRPGGFSRFGSLVAWGIADEADARMIAAAKVMLEALEIAHGSIETLELELGDECPATQVVFAAIRKAKGGAS